MAEALAQPITDYRPRCEHCWRTTGRTRTLANKVTRPWEIRCLECKWTTVAPDLGSVVQHGPAMNR